MSSEQHRNEGIDRALGRHPEVADHAAVTTESGETVVLVASAELSGLDVVLALKDVSGELPARCVVVDALVRDQDGVLPRDFVDSALTRHGQYRYVAPAAPVEKQLADVWSAALGLPRVGVEDDFIDLGGDSLIAIDIAERAEEFGYFFEPGDLFEQGHIRALTTYIERCSSST